MIRMIRKLIFFSLMMLIVRELKKRREIQGVFPYLADE